MSVVALLAELRRRGVELRLADGRLWVSAPLGAMTPQLERELKENEEGIRAYLDSLAVAEAPPPLGRRDRGAGAPLSFAQRRLWFIEQLEPERTLYNVSAAFRTRGELDVAALESSLTEIVRRHEILRSTFVTSGEEPRQNVQPLRRVTLQVLEPAEDLADRETEAIRLATELASARFDLERDLMLRAGFVRLGPRDGVLVFAFHHIAADGWSLNVFEKELVQLYDAATSGAEARRLPVLSVQYADYAAWHREWLSGPTFEQELSWWRARLADLPVVELPTDRGRPREPTRAGRRVGFDFPPGSREALRVLCREERATPFMVLTAAVTAVLHRYTGHEKVGVGTPVANRSQGEIENAIGFFVNTVVLIADFSGEPTFRELVRRVRAATLETLAHQELPFEHLVEALNPSRELSRNPLFSVMIAHGYTPVRSLELAGVTAERLDLDRHLSKFDLTFETWEIADHLVGRLEYSTELYEDATIQRLVDHYLALVGTALSSPDLPVARLPLLGDDERRLVITEWNRTGTPYPSDTTVDALFEERVVAAPEAIAIECGDELVSYAELDRRAERVAAALSARGVGEGALVALRMDRSSTLVVAMLGVLKAGAAYLPIAPEEPGPRVNAVVRETGVTLLISSGIEGDAAATADVATVIAPELEVFQGELGTSPVRDGGRAAYVMYTSGSTGTPKGIAVPHRAIARLVVDPDYVHLGPDDRLSHLSSPAFDATTFEVWGALLNGGRVVIFDRDEVLDPALFSARMSASRPTVMFLTTALFNELAVAAPEALGTLRYLLFGGEAVASDRVRHLLATAPPEHLVHVYGPTESTTFATAFAIKEVAEDARTVPIGGPIARTTCYVLDRLMQPVPIGVPGELWIGGDGLALFYVNNEEMTSERFVPDPFAVAPGARLYRTGDIARWRAGGVLEFLGRRDDQVKLRGFRIELGEVDAALREHPEVEDATTVLRSDAERGKTLIAYVVPATGATPVPGALREHLRGRLPAYMLPSAFVLIDEIPLTPNGKVDVTALPEPERGETSGAEPRTPLERRIAAIIANVLGLEGVGVEDDFFAVGGHSLLAVSAVTRLRAELNVPLQLRHLFLAPTVRSLAILILALRMAAQDGSGSGLESGIADGDGTENR